MGATDVAEPTDEALLVDPGLELDIPEEVSFLEVIDCLRLFTISEESLLAVSSVDVPSSSVLPVDRRLFLLKRKILAYYD